MTTFRPCGIYYQDSDRYEIIVRDAATITVPIPDSDVYWLQDMQTREIVGMGVNFASASLSPVERKEVLRALIAGRCSYCGAVAYGVTPSDCERGYCNYVDASIEQQADAVMDLVAARPRAPVAPLSPVEREEVLRAVDIAISLIDDDADGQWLDVDTVERELKALAARLRSPTPSDSVAVSREWLDNIRGLLAMAECPATAAEIDRLLEVANLRGLRGPLVTPPPAPADVTCPKCGEETGDDWSQCLGSCPMPMSPHYLAPMTLTPEEVEARLRMEALLKKMQAELDIIYEGLAEDSNDGLGRAWNAIGRAQEVLNEMEERP